MDLTGQMSTLAFGFVTRRHRLLAAWAIEAQATPTSQTAAALFTPLGHSSFMFMTPQGRSGYIDPHSSYVLKVTQPIANPTNSDLANEIGLFGATHGKGKRSSASEAIEKWYPLLDILEALYTSAPLITIYNHRRPAAEIVKALLGKAFGTDTLSIYGSGAQSPRSEEELDTPGVVNVQAITTVAYSIMGRVYDAGQVPDQHVPLLIYYFRARGSGREINRVVFAYVAWAPKKKLAPYIGPEGSAIFGQMLRAKWKGNRQHLPMFRTSTDEPPSRAHLAVVLIDPDGPEMPLVYTMFSQLPETRLLNTNVARLLGLDLETSQYFVQRGVIRDEPLALVYQVNGMPAVPTEDGFVPAKEEEEEEFDTPAMPDKLKAEYEKLGIPLD